MLSHFKNFPLLQYLIKKYVLKFLGKVKITKAPTGFELITYRLVVNTLTHCATLLMNYVGKDWVKIKIILDFIFISIGSTSQYGVSRTPLTTLIKCKIKMLGRQHFLIAN